MFFYLSSSVRDLLNLKVNPPGGLKLRQTVLLPFSITLVYFFHSFFILLSFALFLPRLSGIWRVCWRFGPRPSGRLSRYRVENGIGHEKSNRTLHRKISSFRGSLVNSIMSSAILFLSCFRSHMHIFFVCLPFLWCLSLIHSLSVFLVSPHYLHPLTFFWKKNHCRWRQPRWMQPVHERTPFSPSCLHRFVCCVKYGIIHLRYI